MFLAPVLLSALSTLSGSDKPAFTIAYDTPPTPVCGTEFKIKPGETLTFTVQVRETDPNAVAALLFITLPPGSTLSDPNPIVVYGNGVDQIVITNTFSWTPTAAQVGDWEIYFDSANYPEGARLPCTYYVKVEAPPRGTTYTQGGWGSKPNGNNPGALLKANFASLFPTGVEIGIPGAGGFSLKFTTAKSIENFLPQGGTPKALAADATNPTTSAAGVFAGQVLALKLSCKFSAAGITPNGNINNLVLVNSGSLNGKTIADILAIAENVLGGGALPADFASISDLSDLCKNLNEAFDNGNTSGWANGHLANP